MDGKTHQHGSYAYRWMAQYRVGFAENFPQITPPKHVLPDNDGFVDWSQVMGIFTFKIIKLFLAKILLSNLSSLKQFFQFQIKQCYGKLAHWVRNM